MKHLEIYPNYELKTKVVENQITESKTKVVLENEV